MTMKREIWKYALDVGHSIIAMPAGAQVLTVQMQNGSPQLWALVDPTAKKKQRHFRVVGTGHEFDPTGCEYVATFQVPGLVFHVFEAKG